MAKSIKKKPEELKVILMGATVHKKGTPTTGLSREIGGLNADFDDSMMTKELKAALKQIGKRLIKQMKCDAISFDQISFSRMWNRNA